FHVTGVQTCALPISVSARAWPPKAAAASSPHAAAVAASAFRPDRRFGQDALTRSMHGPAPERLKKRAEFLAVQRGERRRGRLFQIGRASCRAREWIT